MYVAAQRKGNCPKLCCPQYAASPRTGFAWIPPTRVDGWIISIGYWMIFAWRCNNGHLWISDYVRLMSAETSTLWTCSLWMSLIPNHISIQLPDSTLLVCTKILINNSEGHKKEPLQTRQWQVSRPYARETIHEDDSHCFLPLHASLQ